MKKILSFAVTGATALALASLSAPAAAGGNVSFGVFVGSPGYGVYMPPPPVIYAPVPMYYAPPTPLYYRPQQYYYGPPAPIPRHRYPHGHWHRHR